jgi:hypothetical protein
LLLICRSESAILIAVLDVELALNRRMLVSRGPAPRERIVYVPVQERYLGVVHRALADAMAVVLNGDAPGDDDEQPPTSGEATKGSPDEDLTQPEIVLLKQTYGNQSVHACLDTLADHAGEWWSFPQLLEATGRSRAELNGDLGGLTQFVRRAFGKNKWPMEWKWSHDHSVALYRMSPDLARWWKDA